MATTMKRKTKNAIIGVVVLACLCAAGWGIYTGINSTLTTSTSTTTTTTGVYSQVLTVSDDPLSPSGLESGNQGPQADLAAMMYTGIPAGAAYTVNGMSGTASSAIMTQDTSITIDSQITGVEIQSDFTKNLASGGILYGLGYTASEEIAVMYPASAGPANPTLPTTDFVNGIQPHIQSIPYVLNPTGVNNVQLLVAASATPIVTLQNSMTGTVMSVLSRSCSESAANITVGLLIPDNTYLGCVQYDAQVIPTAGASVMTYPGFILNTNVTSISGTPSMNATFELSFPGAAVTEILNSTAYFIGFTAIHAGLTGFSTWGTYGLSRYDAAQKAVIGQCWPTRIQFTSDTIVLNTNINSGAATWAGAGSVLVPTTYLAESTI